MTGDEKATMATHFGSRSGLAERGNVLAFGLVDDPSGIVLAEDITEAASHRDGDPAMASSHGFRTEVAFSLVTREGRFDAM